MISIKQLKVRVNEDRCENCKFCEEICKCYNPGKCIGCLACYHACPYEAREIYQVEEERKLVRIEVDDVIYEVPEEISIAKALEFIGFKYAEPGSKKVSKACHAGGCWSCALIVNGELKRTCITPVCDMLKIETNVESTTPLRIIHGPSPHTVGGKATPWYEVNYLRYVEAAIWSAGCNLRCPQCQNYEVTYDNSSTPSTPKEAAELVISCHRRYRTKGIAISGGEPTINRRWLVEFFKEVSKRVNYKVRRHLDSNGTLLTKDYIDELVSIGCNNIGVEPKCVDFRTYMKITGISNEELARKYLENSWKAIEYLNEYYIDKVYIGVGLVYNKALTSVNEIAEAGRKLASINSKIQVTVLDYFAAFRRKYLERPSYQEMIKVKKILEDQGLKTVIVQTSLGHVSPG